MNHCKAEYPERMTAQCWPIGDDENQTRSDKRSKQGNNAEVPDLVGVDTDRTRGALRQQERKQQAERSESAVGRNDDCADLKENWVHLSKNSLSGQKVGRTRPTGP